MKEIFLNKKKKEKRSQLRILNFDYQGEHKGGSARLGCGDLLTLTDNDIYQERGAQLFSHDAKHLNIQRLDG